MRPRRACRGRCRRDSTTRRSRQALFATQPPSRDVRPKPDWAEVHRELQRHKGMTLQLLWLEYRNAHPDGYAYSWCLRSTTKKWRGSLDVVLRQTYRAGEKAFVDYAGPKFSVIDRGTGEVRDVMVFVGVLAASNYTFVDLTWSRALADWTLSHVRMLEFFGGVPELLIPDNEKAGVHKASRYEPIAQPHLPGVRRPLRNHRAPGSAEGAAGPGQGGSRGPAGRTPDHGPAPQPHVLLSRRAARGGRTPTRSAQRTAVPEDRR